LPSGSLSLEAVSFSYPLTRAGVADITFSVQACEDVGIAGGNGAGKTTLFSLLTGLQIPDAGDILIDDITLSRKTLRDVRAKLGLVLQDADDQLFCATALEDVAFGLIQRHLPEDEINRRAAEALRAVGVEHLADRPPFSLSGGEKKLVAIASVLAMEPSVLLMDEPSAGLDPAARRELIGLLKGLPQTKLIASHDLDLLYELCGRVLVLDGGRVAADGSAEDILGDEALMRAHRLEVPPVIALDRIRKQLKSEKIP